MLPNPGDLVTIQYEYSNSAWNTSFTGIYLKSHSTKWTDQYLIHHIVLLCGKIEQFALHIDETHKFKILQ
jgi:hypothetical protein